MICRSCGAQITITDLTCPFCGTQNPEAEEYFKQHERDVLEKEKFVARENAEVQKTRMYTDLNESLKGSGKAMKFLTGFLILCIVVSVISLAIFIIYETKDEKIHVGGERTAEPGTFPAEYQEMEKRYEENMLKECFRFHQYVNEFYLCAEEGNVGDKYAYRNLANYGCSAYQEILRLAVEHADLYKDSVDQELLMQEKTYVENFFRKEFGYTIEECWFLFPEEGYLTSDDAMTAGMELRKRYLEVR